MQEQWRKQAGGRAVKALFEGLSRAAKIHPASRPERHDVEVLRDIPYAPGIGSDGWLDVWRPKGAGPHPVALYIHGGGFRILSKDTHWLMGLALARRGFVTFNINYRLAPQHLFPAAIEDAAQAYTWVLENAERFGGDIDLGWIVSGESAGANLALGVTIATCFEREETYAQEVFETGRVPDAVLPLCGMLQVSDPERFARRKKLPALLEDRILEVCHGYMGAQAPHDLADPLLFLERASEPARTLPPMFTGVGTKDPILDDTRRLAAALERLSVPHQIEYYPGEVHAFHAFLWREQAKKCWKDMFAFLERQGL